MNESITIVEYDDKYADALVSLSLEWLEKYHLLEDADKPVMYHPKEMVIERGGMIWFAVKDGTAVGTVSAVPLGNGVYELAKLAVTQSSAGHGIGRRLAETALLYMEDHRAKEVLLFSNSALERAIGLYERLGFTHVPLGVPEFVTADVKMKLTFPRSKSPAKRTNSMTQ